MTTTVTSGANRIGREIPIRNLQSLLPPELSKLVCRRTGRANSHGEQTDYRRKTKIHTMTNFKIFHNSAPLKDLHQSIKKTQKK